MRHVPTVTFRTLFVLVILAHERRRIVHVAVTEHPTAVWTAQQLRNAFPDHEAPAYLLHDRDAVFAGVATTIGQTLIVTAGCGRVQRDGGPVEKIRAGDARIVEPTDALVRVTRACICGSDLWPYNSMAPNATGNRMGHEFIGVVDAVGSAVRTVKKGDLVVAPFAWSDGTCEFCQQVCQESRSCRQTWRARRPLAPALAVDDDKPYRNLASTLARTRRTWLEPSHAVRTRHG